MFDKVQRRPSVMDHGFSKVANIEIPRSQFDRSHSVKTTFDSGYLIPIFVDEVLPGDTFSLRVNGLARMATPIYPVMDNMYMETFFFFVPYRLIWDNWERFMGEQTSTPSDSIDFNVPQFANLGGVAPETIFDYMGIPPQVGPLRFNSLPFRAYNFIWNEWFRDQNLQNALVEERDDGDDNPSFYAIRRRNKRHDYFTSCLPWPQKGDSVDIPLGTVAPVTGIGLSTQTYGNPLQTAYETGEAAGTPYAANDWLGGTALMVQQDPNNAGFPNIYADLENATAATINQLRQGFQIQRLLEKDARGGTRYPEIIMSHFQVMDPQYLVLQRPEYLGGGSSPINQTIVPNTTDIGGTQPFPQGKLSSYATAVLDGHGFNKSFTEHGVVIGLVNVRADITYQQGLERMFSRQTRYDFYFPVLSQIGEQPVYQREIYADGTSQDDDVFGYQERYAEYRYKPSRIAGQFRSSFSTPLDAWHLAQDFETPPALNASFIEDEPPIDRVIAVDDEPEFILDAFFNLHCARPMPMFGIPGMIDHF